ncbi:TetR/AcrR family transcriptional regulator [Microbacter margulisiae]|uniref:AcrR family transcriptional regulator n=1 Tax=Microbacter margulisiae TaxID=1350067 RepID=A0A7W5DSV3_9PORP|nr:TetR/AcrR family transcriptional regulator [Microbacter margulisiae]MBB3188145.1 AcrR family transcriptional regulator [Microbacter margulisiae]
MEIKKDHDTEKVILETAERLFLEKGFAMTSTVEIAREAGCNQAMVHYYYRSKENLFQSIFEQKLKLLMSSFEETNQKEINFEERLTQIIGSHFEMIRANPKVPFLIFNELITNPSRIDSLKEKMGSRTLSVFMQLQNELQTEIDKGNICQIDMIDLAFSIISLNVMLFLGSPILRIITKMEDAEFESLIEHRKKEHVRIILASLKP